MIVKQHNLYLSIMHNGNSLLFFFFENAYTQYVNECFVIFSYLIRNDVNLLNVGCIVAKQIALQKNYFSLYLYTHCNIGRCFKRY
jgi:hypothetical protein